MKIILFIINIVISLYGTTPIFITSGAILEESQDQIYITVDCGICLDNEGNGMVYGYDEDSNYISYSKVKTASPGDIIYTFCILNPESNEFDDIIGRIDIIENSEEISINMDHVIDYIVTEYGIQLYFEDNTGFWWEW